ncbi:MAG: TIGR01777 family oxidoreductase [Neisseriaceae bacterium]
MKTILITGSNGFIANNFCKKFADKYKFVLVSHYPQVNHITLKQLRTNHDLINSIDAVLNLAGANIGAKRWTKTRKKELLQSRVEFTRELVDIFNKYNNHAHIISASAISIYDFNTVNDENTLIDYSKYKNFSQQITKRWEQNALKYDGLVTITRFGIVLSCNGGIFRKMLRPFLFGVGGQLGNGQQGFPWIALEDLLSALDFIIEKGYGGIFNLTAPEKINNEQFTNCIGHIWHKPTFMKLPAWLIKLVWGQMGKELLLSGNQVIPQRLIDLNFTFKYPYIQNCLSAIKDSSC